MTEFFTTILIFLSGLLGGGEQPQNLGAFSDPFISAQVGASPTNGDCLQTNGTDSTWDPCPSGSGGGISDPFTHPQAGTSATTSGMIVTAASSTFTKQLRAGHLYSDLTGQSSTTLALATNGTNCGAGNYPLGVDASGNVEDCTASSGGLTAYDAWTHPQVGTSATTSGLIVTAASSTFTQQINAANATSTLFTATTAWLTNLFIGADTIAEYISDTAAAFFTGNTETGITVTYQDADNTVDVVCDTASASVFGCLAAADWSTFNSKLSSYDAWTHPTAGTSATTSGMVFNSASSTFTTLLNMRNASTTQITIAGSTWITPLTSALLLTGTDGLLAEYTGSTCTNQAVTAISALGVATCTTLTTAYIADSYLLNTGDVGTGVYDFGGTTSFEITNGTAPAVDAIGEIALDTTSNQLLLATSTAAGAPAVFTANLYPAFTIATSTAWTGTTTDYLGHAFVAEFWDDIMCSTDVGTVYLAFGDGAATTSFFRASTTAGTIQLNKAFTATQRRYVNYGSPVTAPTKLTCTLKKQLTRD